MTEDENYAIRRASASQGRAPAPRKLKDTCDMCSASKVKCDKRKPLCSRCERLGYPCFYSPARRLPKRRHSQQRPNSSSTSHGESPNRGLLQKGFLVESTETIKDKSISRLKTDFSRQLATSRLPTQPQGQEVQDPSLPAVESDMLYGEAAKGKPGMERSIVSENFTTLFDSRFEFHHPLTMSINDPIIQFPNGASPTNMYLRGNSCINCRHAAPPETPTNSDCVSAALGILQNIDMYKLRKPVFCTGGESPLAGIPPNMIAAASIKRISSMLICSCSMKVDIGLLVAAICTSLLDQMQVILRGLSELSRPPTCFLESDKTSKDTSGNTIGKSGSVSNNRQAEKNICGHGVRRHDNHRLNNSHHDGEKHMMQLIEELPRVANVVAQFTQRYSQETDSTTRNLMAALSSSMNHKLKSTTDDVTDWVARI
ncbi:hypothetical protein BGW36DRAFT_363974 [Talaromyces proteolyticus]|uniref:Zn(2)-C6 fungal-type domain-containing protein n=1 Tax=Talaromyces proteolyticus TaxID=1131652 RepID=A0AAD4KM63_9EURO|nr:uncharacterized protein BGW36DRAFT_363974 [Talaromyces proteolyticus]KAH8691647.1 hypothetical protein BGW36DRAFT_363974 [Talaromyces proteolyticus]